MTDPDTFFEMLTEICNELPDSFFQDLHQGVIMSEECLMSPYAQADDLVTLGQYRRSYYGNQIVIYYGSFEKIYPDMPENELKDKIRETVRHEFRHHIEHLAGIYGKHSLEREDEEMIKRYLEIKKGMTKTQ